MCSCWDSSKMVLVARDGLSNKISPRSLSTETTSTAMMKHARQDRIKWLPVLLFRRSSWMKEETLSLWAFAKVPLIAPPSTCRHHSTSNALPARPWRCAPCRVPLPYWADEHGIVEGFDFCEARRICGVPLHAASKVRASHGCRSSRASSFEPAFSTSSHLTQSPANTRMRLLEVSCTSRRSL